MIYPNFSFSCNGRLTSVKASTTIFVTCANSRSYPFFQIWRPLSSNMSMYNLITEIQFPTPTCANLRCNSRILLMENTSTEFHSGDVLGYYQPSSRCQIFNVNANDSILYNISATSSTNTFNINSADTDTLKPLFEVSFGKNFSFLCMYTYVVKACCTYTVCTLKIIMQLYSFEHSLLT